MRYWTLVNLDGRYSPALTLKALLNETDFTDQEVDTIGLMMVGDTFKLEDEFGAYLAVKRVPE